MKCLKVSRAGVEPVILPLLVVNWNALPVSLKNLCCRLGVPCAKTNFVYLNIVAESNAIDTIIET